MTDIASISGKAVINRQVLIRVLSMLTPRDLTRDSNLFDVGYERAKSDLLKVLSETMGKDFSTSNAQKLIHELRKDAGA